MTKFILVQTYKASLLRACSIMRSNGSNGKAIPYRIKVPLHYWYLWNDTTANPGFYDWVIKGNDLYDPDVALGGDSAYGLDEYAALYKYYKVTGSRCEVLTWGYDGNNMQSVAIIPNDSSSAFTAANFPSIWGSSLASRPAFGSLYTQPSRCSLRCTTAKITGVKDIDDVGFQAATNASPTHLWYWHVVGSPLVAAAAKSVKLVHVVYEAEFFSPLQLSH